MGNLSGPDKDHLYCCSGPLARGFASEAASGSMRLGLLQIGSNQLLPGRIEIVVLRDSNQFFSGFRFVDARKTLQASASRFVVLRASEDFRSRADRPRVSLRSMFRDKPQ